MDLKNIENLIQETLELIAVDAKSLVDARNRAARFLVIQSILATFLKNFEEEKAKVKTLETATFAKAIQVADGKNITEKKIQADQNHEYTLARESLERLDGIREYIKTHIRIFENAHLFFRQLGKE